MAYELLIWRSENISEDEWIAAVSAVNNVRIDESSNVAKNPKTGEVIEIQGMPTDASVKFKNGGFLGLGVKETWVHYFRFSTKHGFAIFPYSSELDSSDNPVRIVASDLAKKLNAKIIGEEDEIYDW
jgi:hypothetical protein